MRNRRSLWASSAGLGVLLCLTGALPAGASGGDERGQIAFTRYDDSGSSHITIATARGTHQRELSLPLPADNPVWSPDGSRLSVNVFPPDSGVRPATVRPDGTGFKLLDIPGLPSETDFICLAWSPSGQQLLLCMASNFFGHNADDGVYTVRASDGGGLTRLTVNPYPPEIGPDGTFGGGDQPGGFSPDGRQFVFMRAKPGPDPDVPDRGQTGALFVENSDGTDLRQITPYGVPDSHGDGLESWSPNGRWIAFASAGFQLQLIHPNGTGLHPIPVPADPAGQTFASTPSWSPDGRRLVFEMYRPTPGQADVYTMRPDGIGLRQLTNSHDFEEFPSWTRAEPDDD